MQGERASMGSLSEALNFEHGSTSGNAVVDWESLHNLGDNDLQNYLLSSAETNTTFPNSDLHRFSLGEASSSHNPLFMQPSSGNRVVRNVNLNAEYNEDMNPGLVQVNGLGSGLLPENSARSVDVRRASCKRKALDAGIGQSSSGAFREFHRGESSSSVSGPSFYNDLNNGPRGLVPCTVPNLSSPAITESSSRNFSVLVNNPTAQQEIVSPAVFSAGSVIGLPVAPSLSSGHVPPVDQQLIDLRYRHSFGNFTPLAPNASAASPFQWSGTAGAPIERNVIHRAEAIQRSNMIANPLFVSPHELRDLAHGHISRNASGPGHVASSSSRTSVQPSPSSPTWLPHSPHNHRTLVSSLATNQRAARSLVPPFSPDYPRAVPRQGQTAIGVPHSLRGLASTSRGRSRLAASEFRNALDQMRRSGNLRLEDVMLLNQSMRRGAETYDRYRDMRLDVDNMTYEELLSLEERIGDVCTGVNEETISNRLKQRKYNSVTRSPQEVEPCCICQEEYNEGEEMGMLECGHEFHSQCIKEWLKQKNLCPICKTTGLNTADREAKKIMMMETP